MTSSAASRESSGQFLMTCEPRARSIAGTSSSRCRHIAVSPTAPAVYPYEWARTPPEVSHRSASGTTHGSDRGEPTMEGKKDDIKGRVKEATGDLTDDDDLKREGKTDRAAGSVKDKLEKAKDKGEEVVDKAKDRLQRK